MLFDTSFLETSPQKKQQLRQEGQLTEARASLRLAFGAAMICCSADFVSLGQDPEHYTRLQVSWFQHDYAFPLNPKAERALVALDWENLAEQQEVPLVGRSPGEWFQNVTRSGG